MKEDEGVNVWIVKERRIRIDDLESSDTANPEITFRRLAQPCGVVNSDQFFKAKTPQRLSAGGLFRIQYRGSRTAQDRLQNTR